MAAATAAMPVEVRDAVPEWGITQERVDEAVRRIAEAYNPLRVVAFGSWARGQAKPDSDLDLAVFLDESSSASPGQSLYAAVSGQKMNIDILAFDVARHERLKRSRNSVHSDIEHEGRVLYERAELDPVIEELMISMEDDRAVLSLPAPDRIFGFHAQQSVEKLLKVLIAGCGGRFERSHDLEALRTHLTSLGEHVPLESKMAVALEPFAVEFRYGGHPQLPESREEIVKVVETLRTFVLRRVEDLTPRP